MQRTIFNLLLFPSSLLLVLVMIDLDSCPKVTAFKCSPSASQKTITATDLAPFLTSNLLAILQAAAPPPRPSPERGVTSLRMQAGMSSQIITATYIVLISFQKVGYGSCHAGQIRATPPALIRRQMAAGTVAAPLCIQAKTAGLCTSFVSPLSYLLSVYLSRHHDQGVKYSLLEFGIRSVGSLT
jgi:hypothetical protein